MTRFLLPLAVFAGLVALLWRGLDLDPREIPSNLIDKPAPAFSAPQLHEPGAQIGPADMAGRVWLLNVWASWCVACREEHGVISAMAKEVDIIGLNYKDKRADAIGWLEHWGNPYLASAHDLSGDIGIDYGVYGVPETFVIDQQGRIRYKHIGPVSPDQAKDTLMPIVNSLRSVVN